MIRYFFAVTCLFSALVSHAQLFPAASYPRDYFRDPLDIPMSLAANFGELRPNHYHMGLDIRTQHRENLPVFAAAEGYVVRVQIEPAGFGQAIYIRHPNGYTTVYGHLNKFFPALAAYVSEQQYRQRSWQVDLDFPPSLFPVRKGDLIAYSGNTGGSQGPHLHFEIRRTAGDINMNPLLFGLPVPDNTSPSILRLAWYDRNEGIYEQTPHILPVSKTGAGARSASSGTAAWSITPSLLVVPASRISFALSAFDTQSGSANPNGIYEAILYEDDQAVIGFRMNNISYDNTRNLNAHIDYRTRATGGPFLQMLSLLPGYPPPTIYASPAGQAASGVIDLRDELVHRIRIEVKDTYGNTSSLAYQVRYKQSAAAGTPPPAGTGAPSSVTTPATASAQAPAGTPVPVAAPAGTPAHAGTSSPAGTPTAIGAAAPEERPAPAGTPAAIGTPAPAGKRFYPGMVDGVESQDCAFYLGERSLYDSVTIMTTVAGYPGSGLSLPGGLSATFRIGAPWIPLLEPVLVRLRPTAAATGDSIHKGTWDQVPSASIVMVCFQGQGTEKDVRRPEWRDGWASARFRQFGNFQLVDDRTAPVITPLGPLEGADLSKAARIAFSIKDNLGALRNFRAELDGSWLCFTNDKGLAYIYKFDEHCPPGSHTLKVSAEDVAGNRTTKEYHFTR